MSGRLYKKVLQEFEESKHQGNRDDKEEDDEHIRDSGSTYLCNRFAILTEDNEGPDEFAEETEINDEINVKPASKNKSKKEKKKKKISKDSGSKVGKAETTLEDFTWPETLDNSQETKVLGDSSENASSGSLLKIDPESLNLEKQLTRVYGSTLARSFKNSTYGLWTTTKGK